MLCHDMDFAIAHTYLPQDRELMLHTHTGKAKGRLPLWNYMYEIYQASVKHTLLAAACTFLVLTHKFNNRENTDRYNITNMKNVLCVYGNLIECTQTAAVLGSACSHWKCWRNVRKYF